MNKQEYLAAFEKALKSSGMRDCAEILEEYSEHFDMKAADGYSEDEIAAKLGAPEEIAAQFNEIVPDEGSSRAVVRVFQAIGLFFADIMFAIPIFASLYAWIFSLGAVAVSSALTGVVLTAGIDRLAWASPYINMPYLPYVCSLLIGISLLALAVLATVGTIYCTLYITRLLKVYIRWHKIVWAGAPRGIKTPPKPLHPVIAPKKRRLMRSITLISIVIFAVTLIAGFIMMVISAGALEFWHVWNWFV